MRPAPLDLLLLWLDRHLASPAQADGRTWLAEARTRLAAEHAERDLYLAVGLAPRKVGKDAVALTAEDLEAADGAREGWRPAGLTADEAARLALLLTAANHGPAFFDAFDALWRTADVGEQICFYKGLPLYPEPERFLWRATDGCRTNIRLVFEAIAHNNPYVSEHFDEVAFNQVCLKALFVGTTLHPIMGLDDRANPRLARMMTDYAYERWAAKRTVSPELWRCVGPAADERGLLALSRALVEPDAPTRAAAALACHLSPVPGARALTTLAPDEIAAIEAGTLTWETVSQSVG